MKFEKTNEKKFNNSVFHQLVYSKTITLQTSHFQFFIDLFKNFFVVSENSPKIIWTKLKSDKNQFKCFFLTKI